MIIRSLRPIFRACLLEPSEPVPRCVWSTIQTPHTLMSGTKRPLSGSGTKSNLHGKKNKKFSKLIKEGAKEAILLADVNHLLSNQERPATPLSDQEGKTNYPAPESRQELPERFSEIEVTISELSSTGEGLGLSSSSPDHVYVVPFALPGDVVKARIVHQFSERGYTLTDFLKVIDPSSLRRDDLVRCPYFAKCGGCQFQMLPYEAQLDHKKTVIEKAYRNFSNLLLEAIPSVADTIESPLQYGYRTKLTPHFDGPPGASRRGPKGSNRFTKVPPIGYLQKGTRKTIDIEQCPIGTPALQEGLQKERQRVADEISKYRKGATILLRETTKRVSKVPRDGAVETTPALEGVSNSSSLARKSSLPYTESKTYVTDNNASTYEYVDQYKFANPAGAFFQNNNSILPTFTNWIREHILPSAASLPNKTTTNKTIINLLDTYSGSGLFTITLSSLFRRSLGIDISSTSIASALENLTLNGIPTESANFLPAADASNLFATAIEQGFDPDETVVIIDPPRKGCDESFIRRLRNFGPKRLCYVSCDVHTQARDVGMLCGLADDTAGGDRKEFIKVELASGTKNSDNVRESRQRTYELEQLQGFDFFPQTGHVESVALLNRIED